MMDSALRTVLRLPIIALKFFFWTIFGLFFLGLASCSAYSYFHYHGEKFDRASWDAARDERSGKDVCGMYGDIKANVLRIGMTQDQVEEKLGSQHISLDNRYQYGNHFAYIIGLCGSWDSTYLVVMFNENGRLSKITTYQN